MWRSYLPGLMLLLMVIAAALAGPETAGVIARSLYDNACKGGLPCNRVTGVAMPEEPSLADLFLHHPPSVPTR